MHKDYKPLYIISLLIVLVLFGINIYAKSYAEQRNYTHTNPSIVTTTIWKDITVKYDTNTVSTNTAVNLFEAQYGQYSKNLQELTIFHEDNAYQLTLSFQDGTTKQATVPLN